MIWRSIEYELPSVAPLLFAVGFIAWGLAALYYYRERKLHAFGTETVLKAVLESRSPLHFGIKSGLCCLIWICGVLALMQPKGNERYLSYALNQQPEKSASKTIVRKKMHEVILLIDASASMAVTDAYGGRSRLANAKQIADEVVSRLRGENVSLFAFTSATIQLVPSTTDYLFTRLMLEQLGINEGESSGTDIKQALETVRKSYFSMPSPKARTLVLFTDGGDTLYESLQGDEQRRALTAILKPIAEAKELNLQVFVVGIGSEQGQAVPDVSYHGHSVKSALDLPLLKKLSIAGSGHLLISNEMTPFHVAQSISNAIAQESSFIDTTENPAFANSDERVYDLFYQVPLGIAILALAMVLLLPDTRKKRKESTIPFRFSIFVAAFNFFSFSLVAQPEDKSTLQAEIFFDAKDYDQARTQYELIFEDHLPAWQDAILKYDIGTVLLAQGKWEESLLSFHAAAIEKVRLPLLSQRLTQNIALAHLLFAQVRMQALTHDTSSNDADYQSTISLFRQVLADLKSATTASCELDKAEGAKVCSNPLQIIQMRRQAKNQLANLLQNYLVYHVEHITLQEGAAMLYAGIQAIEDHLRFLQDPALNVEMGKKYLTYYLRQVESWQLMWSALQHIINKSPDEAQKNILQQANQDYTAGLTAMQQGNLILSQAAFAKSQKSLDDLLSLAIQGDPLKVALQRLYVNYGVVLAQEPLQEISIGALVISQAGIHDIVEKTGNQKLKDSYIQAQHILENGQQALAASKPIQARMYFEFGRYLIQSMLQQLDTASIQKPDQILEQIIALEELSLKLSQMRRLAQEEESISKEINLLPMQSQVATLQAALTFQPAVIKQQTEAFDTKSKRYDWDGIMELFGQGVLAAQQANEWLSDDLAQVQAIPLQEKAVAKWKEALAKLRKGTAQEEKQKNTPQKAPELSGNKQPSSNTSMDNVLRVLQELEQDDRSHPQLTTPPANKGEERPW